MSALIATDAPRCLRCGVRLPLHVAGCPELPRLPVKPPDTLPGRPGYVVTDVSRFDEIHEENDQ